MYVTCVMELVSASNSSLSCWCGLAMAPLGWDGQSCVNHWCGWMQLVLDRWSLQYLLGETVTTWSASVADVSQFTQHSPCYQSRMQLPFCAESYFDRGTASSGQQWLHWQQFWSIFFLLSLYCWLQWNGCQGHWEQPCLSAASGMPAGSGRRCTSCIGGSASGRWESCIPNPAGKFWLSTGRLWLPADHPVMRERERDINNSNIRVICILRTADMSHNEECCQDTLP